jgi:hypothetical protein
MNKNEIKKDLLAFADDDSDVLFEPNGNVMFYKNETEQICRIYLSDEGNLMVNYQETDMPYRTFIAKHLAKLDLFARRIFEKRKKINDFVDGNALLRTVYKDFNGTALELLRQECDNFLEFGSKINFITADAGHGKSVLLKQFQYLQAERYINNESKYLFWHVDLQGRDLVRLGEAIMYDLGELRLPGLYYPSIINLIQKRFIILAIDGFDELAAEIGGFKAVSSLSNFVNEMDGKGTLIAASRRTFFNTHDYLKRTAIFKNKVPFDLIFNELKLVDWQKKEDIQYFINRGFHQPEIFYDSILAEVHDVNHPVLTRPFLLAKLASAIDGNISEIADFFSQKGKENESVSYIVESFIRREVEKWKGVDNQTGKPYLSFDQHIQLLATLAKEMWESKKDTISIEEIELTMLMLCDEWKIEEDLRQIIVRIVGSHAFLIPLSESKVDTRKFDHDEFKNYFLARSMAGMINRFTNDDNYSQLKKFLYIDQLPDSVAMYCFNYVDNLAENVFKIIDGFKQLIAEEWKPTYLQINVGTLFPFLIDKIEFADQICFDAKVSYSSLIFENKQIKNVRFENGTFLKISIRETTLDNIYFKNCEFTEIKIEQKSRIVVRNVIFDNNHVNSIVLLLEGEVEEIAYSPERISELLIQSGITIVSDHKIFNKEIVRHREKSDFKKSLCRFILKFNKMTVQYETNIINDKYLGSSTSVLLDDVIPFCYENKIIELVENKLTKQTNTKAWRLLVDIEHLFKCDGDTSDHVYSKFWQKVNSR